MRNPLLIGMLKLAMIYLAAVVLDFRVLPAQEASSSFGPNARTHDASQRAIQFNRDIRPILSENCYACHGPDKNKRKAGLRLDQQVSALAKLESGDFAIVPGEIAKSKLLRLVASGDDDKRMPPPKTGKRLTAEQVGLVRDWIAGGAPWQGHWSYLPPQRSVVPGVRRRNWPAGNLDRFILARLEKEGLAPAPEADRVALVRRLSFDLTGLPPRPGEVAAFQKDQSAQAYERLVDRLLASPHYGERMAIPWLDLVRYADTDGFHADNYRSVFPYRDYVIKAFNENKRFDQFTTEQIAGDLLPNATIEQKIASTYNRLQRTTEEGGSQAKEYLAKYAADRVRTTSTVWLAGTMGCTECHDHKFDPFTTRDFYSLEAFFADIKEVGVGKPEGTLIPDQEQAVKLRQYDAEIAQFEQALKTQTPELDATLAKWESEVATKPPPEFGNWFSVGPFLADSFNAAFKETFEPEKETDLNKSYQDGKLRWMERSNWEDGKVIDTLTGDNAATYLFRKIKVTVGQPLYLSLGSDDGIKVWLDGKEVLSKKVNRAAAPDQEKITVQLETGENRLLMKIVNASGSYAFYFKPGGSVPETILAVLKTPLPDRAAEQKEELAAYYRSIAPELNLVRDQLAATKKQREEFVKGVSTTLASVAVEPRTIRILPRGNWMRDDGEIVSPAVPQFLPHEEITGRRANRIDLANWLVSRENPLTARVFVNRLWKLYFGAGLSKNLDDLGAQGEWPKHPELLDWLALEFMESGWDVKHMVKLMVMSRTYRQTSAWHDDRLRERDPYNRLLARQSSFRLDAEILRDNALAISGLLVDKIGGPSVKPYQPAGFWSQLNFPKREYTNSIGEAQYRRGLYTFLCRTFPHPAMTTFDAPSREECAAERMASNTPLQALVLLDDPSYVEAARAFAERIMRRGGAAPEKRIEWAFDQALNRGPDRKELKVLADLYREQLAEYRTDRNAAEKMLTVGYSPPPPDLDAIELAAWTAVSRTIFNLHETITRF